MDSTGMPLEGALWRHSASHRSSGRSARTATKEVTYRGAAVVGRAITATGTARWRIGTYTALCANRGRRSPLPCRKEERQWLRPLRLRTELRLHTLRMAVVVAMDSMEPMEDIR